MESEHSSRSGPKGLHFTDESDVDYQMHNYGDTDNIMSDNDFSASLHQIKTEDTEMCSGFNEECYKDFRENNGVKKDCKGICQANVKIEDVTAEINMSGIADCKTPRDLIPNSVNHDHTYCSYGSNNVETISNPDHAFCSYGNVKLENISESENMDSETTLKTPPDFISMKSYLDHAFCSHGSIKSENISDNVESEHTLPTEQVKSNKFCSGVPSSSAIANLNDLKEMNASASSILAPSNLVKEKELKEKDHFVDMTYKFDTVNTSMEISSDVSKAARKPPEHTESSEQCNPTGAISNQSDAISNKNDDLAIYKKSHRCEECGSYFSSSSYLSKHKKIHSAVKPFKCDQCDSTFTFKIALNKHMQTHSGEKPYKCDQCNSCFSCNTNLKEHKRYHTGERPYRCDHCGAHFFTSSSLTVHKRKHSGEKPYKCDQCDSRFPSNSALNQHKVMHSGQKPYKCDQCGVSFARYFHLEDHKLIHSGEKKYKCDQCDSSFTRANNLTVHMRRHTGEKPYKCDVCDFRFAQSGGLKKHRERKKH